MNTCAACRHWVHDPSVTPRNLPGEPVRQGTCKRYPPIPLPDDAQALPRMVEHDWCGEWAEINVLD